MPAKKNIKYNRMAPLTDKQINVLKFIASEKAAGHDVGFGEVSKYLGREHAGYAGTFIYPLCRRGLIKYSKEPKSLRCTQAGTKTLQILTTSPETILVHLTAKQSEIMTEINNFNEHLGVPMSTAELRRRLPALGTALPSILNTLEKTKLIVRHEKSDTGNLTYTVTELGKKNMKNQKSNPALAKTQLKLVPSVQAKSSVSEPVEKKAPTTDAITVKLNNRKIEIETQISELRKEFERIDSALVLIKSYS